MITFVANNNPYYEYIKETITPKMSGMGRLFCEECDTEVCGSFELPVLARLTENEQQFAIAFIKSSGSLKDMAKNMGVSYPTVRNVLDDLIDKLNKME